MARPPCSTRCAAAKPWGTCATGHPAAATGPPAHSPTAPPAGGGDGAAARRRAAQAQRGPPLLLIHHAAPPGALSWAGTTGACECWAPRTRRRQHPPEHSRRATPHPQPQLREELGAAALRGLDPPPRRSLAAVNRKCVGCTAGCCSRACRTFTQLLWRPATCQIWLRSHVLLPLRLPLQAGADRAAALGAGAVAVAPHRVTRGGCCRPAG